MSFWMEPTPDLVTEVMVWTSLQKFCSQNFPSHKFKSDAARKAFLEKRGVVLQNDENGIPGVAVPKEGDGDLEQKEIRIGKRLSATKVKQMTYDEDIDRGVLNAQHNKNAGNLRVQSNSKDWWLPVLRTKAWQRFFSVCCPPAAPMNFPKVNFIYESCCHLPAVNSILIDGSTAINNYDYS